MTEIPDLYLAQACVDIYDDTCTTFSDRWEFEGCVSARRQINGHDLIVFRGSKAPIDWFHNFASAPVPVQGMGRVHIGFLRGLFYTMMMIQRQLGPSIYVTGHSLGAARALLFGRLLGLVGMTPRAIVAFAPPKPGFEDFRDGLLMQGSEIRCYENEGDPVPDVPLWPFIQPVPIIKIHVPPAPDDDSILRCHHMSHYLKWIEERTL